MHECTDEQWAPIADHVGYDVSSCGRVRSWRSPGKTAGLSSTAKLLTGSPGCANGVYLLVSLQEPRRRRYMHDLVAAAFLGPRPAGLVIAHGDGDGHNNHASNLRYTSQRSNIADKWSHGTMLVGAALAITTLTDEQVVEIRERYAAGAMQRDLADEYGTAQQVVSHIVRGETWTHLGGPRTVRWSKRGRAA